MLRRRHEYDEALEQLSVPVMRLIDYEEHEDGVVTVKNETAHLYRYFDATPMAEALYGWVEQTVRDEFRREVELIAGFREIRQAIETIVALPDKQTNLFVALCLQNNGRLSLAKRERHFARLTNKEVSALQKVVQAHMSSLREGAAKESRGQPDKSLWRTGSRRNSF